MIDVTSDSIMTLSQAARQLPDRLHVSTLHRWANRGIRGVRLEVVRLGGRVYTSAEALQRFAQQLSQPARGTCAKHSPDREQRLAAAESALDQAGIGGADNDDGRAVFDKPKRPWTERGSEA